ncbi:MAG: NAD(P)/FAD-dependent oxidoreductase [Ignavibacteriales bacterium]|nr:MAG: NAD(P)/FAD-dependent oxidoreductase [Ignavibacteriales bacterium]
MNQHIYDVIIIGGGAAGFFTAINIAERSEDLKILILEKDIHLLSKVKISGGGRCNVTNSCFDIRELISNYPRGGKELIGPFHTFSTGDTVHWFEKRGVKLKTESDGRIFPVTNDSQTIINCFIALSSKHKIEIMKRASVTGFSKEKDDFVVQAKAGDKFTAKKIVLTSGSNKSMWGCLAQTGHRIIEPVPSLFTFNVKDNLLKGLSGVSVENVVIKLNGFSKSISGPLLITHWGLSGPAVLKLSAFAARELSEVNYKNFIVVDWVPGLSRDEIISLLKQHSEKEKNKMISKTALFNIPRRLLDNIIDKAEIDLNKQWGSISRKEMNTLSEIFKSTKLFVDGKSTFKEEFVTAGGVDLKEVNFKSMESKLVKNLFFAGEVLNIDAVTGGFNFQAAWTTAWIAAKSISEKFGKKVNQEKK